MKNLQDILQAEDAELADLGTIGTNVNTLVAAHNSDVSLITELQTQVQQLKDSGNTGAAQDLQQIADKLDANRAAIAPILAAFATASGTPSAVAQDGSGTSSNAVDATPTEADAPTEQVSG